MTKHVKIPMIEPNISNSMAFFNEHIPQYYFQSSNNQPYIMQPMILMLPISPISQPVHQSVISPISQPVHQSVISPISQPVIPPISQHVHQLVIPPISQSTFNNNFDSFFNDVHTWYHQHKSLPTKIFTSNSDYQYTLYKWCEQQRRNYHSLSIDQVKKLESLNQYEDTWFWDIITFKNIPKSLELLENWKILHKRLPSSRSKNTKERRLGLFMHKHNSKNKKQHKIKN